VLAISALDPGGAVDNEPLQLSALAGRGELEYASDVVLLLVPRTTVGLASAACVRGSPGLGLLELVVAKNRYGEANRVIPLLFRPATGDFQEEPTI
jgi:replicative DNA helicase